MRRAALLLGMALLAGCVERGRREEVEYGRPGPIEVEARRSIQPEQPAVQPAGNVAEVPGAGFDIRLVRVQPGVHLRTVQACDVIFSSRPEAVESGEGRYGPDIAQRMAIKCHAPTGEGWADLVFSRADASRVSEVRRGRRLRVRLLAADGGYFDYPIVQFVAAEGHNPELARATPRAQPLTVPNGFDFTAIQDDPALVGSVQQCAVAFSDEIQIVQPNDLRRRTYPTGVQNRITVRCKHAGGEVPVDLVFMPSQALAALSVRRGEVVPVQIITRNGGFSDHPIVQFAGQ